MLNIEDSTDYDDCNAFYGQNALANVVSLYPVSKTSRWDGFNASLRRLLQLVQIIPYPL